MQGNQHEMITVAERRFPVPIRNAVPPSGLGTLARSAACEILGE
jgi:hypothetical protein